MIIFTFDNCHRISILVKTKTALLKWVYILKKERKYIKISSFKYNRQFYMKKKVFTLLAK